MDTILLLLIPAFVVGFLVGFLMGVRREQRDQHDRRSSAALKAAYTRLSRGRDKAAVTSLDAARDRLRGQPRTEP